jgi:hypothetical protein
MKQSAMRGRTVVLASLTWVIGVTVILFALYAWLRSGLRGIFGNQGTLTITIDPRGILLAIVLVTLPPFLLVCVWVAQQRSGAGRANGSW